MKYSNVFGTFSYFFLFLVAFMFGAAERIIEVEGLTHFRINLIIAIIWFISMILIKNKFRKIEREKIEKQKE